MRKILPLRLLLVRFSESVLKHAVLILHCQLSQVSDITPSHGITNHQFSARNKN